MFEKEPSRTAFAAAAHRAAHQILDQGRIFSDPLALSVLGMDAETVSRHAEAEPSERGMRLFIASRTRFAEAELEAGMKSRGIRQLVVLGAGLDTFAYRHPLAHRLRIFEVDHPATQAWKRRRLRESGITIPQSLVFVPVDFERDALSSSLETAGFDPDQRTFFIWLGVVPYLSGDTVISTLTSIAKLPGGAEVVFDYSNPLGALSSERHAIHKRLAERVAAVGEPFLSYFDTATLHAALVKLGLIDIEDCDESALVARYVAPQTIPARLRHGALIVEQGGHVIWAATKAE